LQYIRAFPNASLCELNKIRIEIEGNDIRTLIEKMFGIPTGAAAGIENFFISATGEVKGRRDVHSERSTVLYPRLRHIYGLCRCSCHRCVSSQLQIHIRHGTE